MNSPYLNNVIDMTKLQYVFAENIQRFYAHKSLSKYYRDIVDAHDEEEDLEELAEQAEHEQLDLGDGEVGLSGLDKEIDLFRDIMGDDNDLNI